MERASGSVRDICPLGASGRRDDLVLQSDRLCRRFCWLRAVDGVQHAAIAIDTLLDLLQARPHLRLGKVSVAVIDGLELAAISGDELLGERVEIPAQHHKLPTDVAYADAIVLAEVGNRLEVRCYRYFVRLRYKDLSHVHL
jgi:hypothetical protein